MPNAQFFNPQNELEAKRRMRMAKILQESSQTPQAPAGTVVAQSPWAALARGVMGGVGQYQERLADESISQDATDRQKFLQQAVMNSGGDMNKMAEQFVGQPDYAETGVKMMLDAKAQERADAREERMQTQQDRMYNLSLQRLNSGGGGGQDPAPLKLANAYQKAIKDGDFDKAKNIMIFAKGLEKGQIINPDGTVGNISGFNDARFDTKTSEAKGTEFGKDQGDALATLKRAEAALPNLYDVATKLQTLGKTATSTWTGRGVNWLATQTDQTPRQAAIDRGAYIATIDNEILPLLRTTFGAQFTQKEGESLKATLGDPDTTPEQKDAILRAFIQQKYANIDTLARTVGQTPNRAPIPENLQGNVTVRPSGSGAGGAVKPSDRLNEIQSKYGF